MATVRQRKLAENIVKNSARKKPLNKQEIVVSSGYSPMSAKSSAHLLIEQEGVKEVLEEMGFTEENAKKVVTDIMLDKKVNPIARLKATDQLFKVKGTYAPEKSVSLVEHISNEHKERALKAIRGILGRGDSN